MGIALIAIMTGCEMQVPEALPSPEEMGEVNENGLVCNAQAEQTDYEFYKMNSDGTRIGDVMPYYDNSSGKFYIYYLKDVWNDATHQRHPWYGFTTSNFYSYSEISAGEVLASSSDGCDQDFAIGTGSVIKRNNQYYAFYTGHNPNFPSSCVSHKEGIMLARSNHLNSSYGKQSSFSTIYAPQGLNFDEQDNFRDPYVYYDSQNSEYAMLISARKDVNGLWKGVLAKFVSSNLNSWSYDGVFYDGGSENFFMMECAELFEMNGTWYLLFSDIDTKYVYYRMSSSPSGPWQKPSGNDRMVGKGIYAAKTAADGYDRYLFGWNHINQNHSDSGNPLWGGNLVVHKLYQKANGDLAVTIPHTLEAKVETNNYSVVKDSQWGNVTNTTPGTHSYRLISPADYDMANVIFDPVTAQRYEISATVSYQSSSRDFGFMIGACDGWNDLYSLRFVPSQNRFSFDKTPRTQITASTAPDNDVPFSLSPNTDYNVRILVENSMVIVYINDEVALTSRIYRAPGTSWGIFSDNSDATFSNILVTTP